MNKELKQEWVNALRSGKYEQCHETLKCNGRFCALGVLGDILERYEEDFTLFDENEDTAFWEWNGTEGASEGRLPTKLINKYDMTYDDQYFISNMNDGSGEFRGNPKSFTEIADWIEENL
jgi:hypothetical protein